MDRFEYTDPQIRPGEEILYQDEPVRLYDGDTKVSIGQLNLKNIYSKCINYKRQSLPIVNFALLK